MLAYEDINAEAFPVHRGSYLIERYLLDDTLSHLGCWVEGDTVRGHIGFPTGSRCVLTRPVFAYRSYLGLHSTLDSDEAELELSIAQGHQVWFTPQGESFRTSVKLESVNVLSGLETGTPAAHNWRPVTAEPCTLHVAGATRYAVSQLELVYAHWSSVEAPADQALFDVQPDSRPENRPGTLFLSSVATSLVVAEPVFGELVAPLTRKHIYHLTMNLGHAANAPYGWAFDERALVDRFLNY